MTEAQVQHLEKFIVLAGACWRTESPEHAFHILDWMFRRSLLMWSTRPLYSMVVTS